jgi:hypothetical protein
MFRQLLALAALTLAAAPAAAATYAAKPAVPATDSQIAGRDMVWNCGPAACVGSTQNSRPLVICQGLAKKAGRIESFTVDGRELAAAELERCNASARTTNDSALANAR